MTDRPTNDEREALIAGDRAGALGPEEAADLALLAELLADPSTWAEPDPALEEAVVAAVAGAEPAALADADADAKPEPAARPTPIGPTAIDSRPRRQRRRGVALSVLAVAAAVVIVLGVVVATRNGTRADFKAQLTATAIAPGASGSAAITHNDAGFRIQLNAAGLPATAGRSVLPGVVEERARDPRADRDIQFQRRSHHPLVGRFPGRNSTPSP